MIRRLGFVVLVTALIVSACGRQVTPNPTGLSNTGLQPGFFQVKYTVAAPFNFATTRYLVVFNTSGTGTTPYSNAQQTNFQNYSFAFVVGGNGTTVGQPVLLQYVNQGNGSAVTTVNVPYTPQLLFFNPNSNGQGTQFSIAFSRSLFNGILTPSPSPSPTTPPTATPTPSGTPTPGQNYSNTIYFNAFTTDVNANTLDAMGTGGAQDLTFQGGPYFLTDTFDNTIPVPAGAVGAAFPAAQIVSIEISNNP